MRLTPQQGRTRGDLRKAATSLIVKVITKKQVSIAGWVFQVDRRALGDINTREQEVHKHAEDLRQKKVYPF